VLEVYKKGADDAPTKRPTVVSRTGAGEGAGRVLVCAKCGHRVTNDGERIEVNDRHEHDAMNPHGFAYHFGCFAHAPGVTARGEQSGHWSWFSGYRWQTAYCGGCAHHLGWLFLTNSDRFYGLILDRITDADE
jgi:hypothetical protein